MRIRIEFKMTCDSFYENRELALAMEHMASNNCSVNEAQLVFETFKNKIKIADMNVIKCRTS